MSDRPFRTMQVEVETAGTAVQFPATKMYAEDKILIKASPNNTGVVAIANSEEAAAVDSGECFTLQPNEAVEIDADNLKEIWMDAETDGNLVEVILA